MPVFQIGLDDGRSLRIEADDQEAALAGVQHFQDSEKPSGAGAGFAHGVAGVASGIASTLGLGGIKSDTLNNVAAGTEPSDYKAAPLIRPGGHFYNPSDWQPGNIPQFAAEMAPGLATDIAAGKTGAMIGNKVAGVRGSVIGGLGAGLGSMALRTFGPGAHENAAARTGDVNAPVTGADMLREGGKQLLEAPINAAGLNRFLPGVGGSALKKYLTTIGTEAATSGGRDAVGQAVTNVGQEHGKEFDPNRTAEATVGGGMLGGTLAAPKLAGDTASNIHFRNSERTPEAKAASEALATRILDAAGGKPLVSATGNTEVGATSYNNAHAAVHRELATASKGEALSTDNANTLARINEGGKVSDASLSALATEASPETMHLAHQAIESARLAGMGNVTDKKFTGGLSGAMEKLAPIANPVKTLGAAGLVAAGVGHAAGLGLMGTYGLPVIGGILGTYGGARVLDKVTGLRSPVQGFTDRYGGTDTPVRNEPQPTGLRTDPLSTSVPQVAPPQDTALWGTPAAPEVPKPTLAAQNADIRGMLQMAAARRKIAQQQAPVTTDEPAPAPEAPFAPSPIAKSMLLAKLKAGLPPPPVEPAPQAPAPLQLPVISPIARKMLEQKLKQGLPPTPAPPQELPVAPPAPPEAPSFNPTALAMLKQKMKMGLPPEPAPQAPAPEAQPPAPVINPVALKMTQARMRAGLPPDPTPPAAPAPEMPSINPTALAMVQKKMKQGLPAAPASPEIAAAMQTVASHNAAPAPATPAPPAPPIISKIMKKAGKPVEAQQAPAEDQPYTPIPEENLWRKQLRPTEAKTQDELVADKELSSYGPKVREKYGKNVIENRVNKRDIAESIANDHTPADANVAAEMYHQLDHISRRAEARKAIKHYTKHMTAEAANAVNAHFTPKVMEKMWKSE